MSEASVRVRLTLTDEFGPALTQTMVALSYRSYLVRARHHSMKIALWRLQAAADLLGVGVTA